MSRTALFACKPLLACSVLTCSATYTAINLRCSPLSCVSTEKTLFNKKLNKLMLALATSSDLTFNIFDILSFLI